MSLQPTVGELSSGAGQRVHTWPPLRGGGHLEFPLACLKERDRKSEREREGFSVEVRIVFNHVITFWPILSSFQGSLLDLDFGLESWRGCDWVMVGLT